MEKFLIATPVGDEAVIQLRDYSNVQIGGTPSPPMTIQSAAQFSLSSIAIHT